MEYALIALVCFFVYFRSLKYDIVVDDVDNRKKHVMPHLESRRHPVKRLFRKLNGEYPIKSVVADHAINVLIHTINCMLLYTAFGSLPASLLFAVCTSNNQVSIWLNGKRYGISAMLCLLSYVLAPFGMFIWLLAPFFQASSMSFPILMAIYGNVCFLPIIIFGLLVGDKYILRWAHKRFDKNPVEACKAWDNRKIVFILKTIAYYFIRGIGSYVPNMYPNQFKKFGISKEHTDRAYRFDMQALAGSLLVLTIPIAYGIDPGLFAGAMFWLITILVYSNWITITVPLAERYMYLPNMGLMLFLHQVLCLIHPLAWAPVFCIYLTRTMTFMPMYKDMDAFLKHHTYWHPESDSAWIYRANYHEKNDDIFGVMHLANEGLLKDPNSPFLWLHKARGFAKIGKKELNNQAIEMALRVSEGELRETIKSKIVNTPNGGNK